MSAFNDRRKPFQQKATPQVFRKASTSLGWSKPIETKFAQLRASIQSAKQLIDSSFATSFPEAVQKGLPTGYKRDFIFEPEQTDLPLTFVRRAGPITVGTHNFNYVVRDGITYDIDMIIPGPGWFVAEFVKIHLTQRLYVPGTGVFQIPISGGATSIFSYGYTKYNIPNPEPSVPPVLPPLERPVEEQRHLNFFWNIEDLSSNRKLANDLMSQVFLLNMQENNMWAGNYFTFDAPWVFKPDSQVQLKFRPTHPYVQLAASSSILPFGFDDRENNNTVRNNAVTVSFELHGTRFLNLNDLKEAYSELHT